MTASVRSANAHDPAPATADPSHRRTEQYQGRETAAHGCQTRHRNRPHGSSSRAYLPTFHTSVTPICRQVQRHS